MDDQGVYVPPLLKVGHRGVNVKVWALLRVNPDCWFTSQEIAQCLEMPLSTVQLALKNLRLLAPRVVYRDKPHPGKGRPKKEYQFQRIKPIT